ncbi:phage tail tape measure protein [Jannaschia sp. Os4]|uniref:phage tail tape measure protein n=1 Tax=Jannaschia sp. Os4 TaxID=2807617 RepID=UPI00193A7924|nr:phage tail tape measure protein [Jannaschia sp. Os4]MBM2576810.1 phage tail tape measure protein [Jannaschia sp. Os4]
MDEAEARLDALEARLGDGGAAVARFTSELSSLQGAMTYTSREVQGLSRSIGGGLRRAFDGLVFDGMKLSDALEGVARSMINAAYNTAMKPVQQAAGGLIAGAMNAMPFADGGAFASGRVMPFATGGIVSGPTTFPMRGGTGLMGEAGPEAIMPLRRGADGRLGVAAAGGSGPVQVTMNITTPDVSGFRRSRSQVAAELSRALSRGQRNR